MCWNGPASAAIAASGFASSFFLWKKGEPKEIYLPPAYFVFMEGLQALTYIVVGDCGNPVNTWLTRAAIIHISFQPWFINMLGMEFVDKAVKMKVRKWVYLFCALATTACLMRLIPLSAFFGRCELGHALCSHTQTCAYRGQWHIGWNVLLNGFNERWIWYLLAGFLLPVIYGSWKWSAYHYIVGPLMASMTTSDVNERPAVWCLFSTMIIALLVNTRIRNYIYVKRWYPWRFMGKKPNEPESPPEPATADRSD